MIEKIANIIQAADIARRSTNLYIGGFQETFDDAVCLFQEAGAVQPYQSDYGSDWVGVQALCRGFGDYPLTTAWQVHFAISGLYNLHYEDFKLVQTTIQNTPAQFDTDSKGRRMVSAHYMYLIAWRDSGNRLPLAFSGFPYTLDFTL